MGFKLRAAAGGETRPAIAFGDADIAAVGRPGVFVRHLEEDQVGQLLKVVAVADAVVAQRGTEAPDLGDDGGGVHLLDSVSWRASASPGRRATVPLVSARGLVRQGHFDEASFEGGLQIGLSEAASVAQLQRDLQTGTTHFALKRADQPLDAFSYLGGILGGVMGGILGGVMGGVMGGILGGVLGVFMRGDERLIIVSQVLILFGGSPFFPTDQRLVL